MSGPRARPRPARAPASLALLAAVALALAPGADGLVPVSLDGASIGIPALELAVARWRADRAADWCPTLGLGWPAIGDPSLGLGDPLYALGVLLEPSGVLRAQLGFALAWAVAGAWALAGRLGLGRGGRVVAAAAYGLGGAHVAHLQVNPYLSGGAWLPWAALGVLAAAGAPGRGRLGGLALAGASFAAMFLAGAAELCVFGGAFAVLLAALDPGGPAPPGPPGSGAPRRALLAGVAAAALAVGLAAPGVVAAVHAFGETTRRAGLEFTRATGGSLHPLELLGLVAPGLFHGGGLSATHVGAGARPWSVTLYVGPVAAALVALGLATVPRDRRARALALAAAPCLLWAIGRLSPLYLLAWHALPGAQALRFPAKAFLPVALALALLAGVGWGRAAPATLTRPLAATLAVIAALAGWGAAAGADALVTRLAAPLGFGVAAWTWSRARRPRRAHLLAIVVLDLALAARGAVRWVEPDVVLAPSPLAAAALAEQTRRGAPLRVAPTAAAVEPRPEDVALGGWPPGALTLGRRRAIAPISNAPLGLRAATSSGGFGSRRVEALLAGLGSAPPGLPLRLLACDLVVLDAEVDRELAARAEPPLARDGALLLVPVPGAPAWASVLGEVVPAPDLAAAVAAVRAPGFDPARACVVEGWTAPPPDPAASGPREARVTHRSDDRLVVETRGPGGALVLRDAWHPGWRATVDGAPAPVLPADAVFRAVPVPAGPRVVELRYEAPGRRAAWAVAAVALAIAAGLGLAGAWAARPRP